MDIGFQARILMGNYKDIQHERIETYNRLIGFIKDKIAPRIISQGHYETRKNGESHKENETKMRYALPDDFAYLEWGQEILKTLYEASKTKKGMKKYKFVVEQIINAKIKCPSDIADLVWFYTIMYDTEKKLYNKLDAYSKDHLFRRLYLDNIKGVGAVASTGIIAWLAPLSKFSNPSKLYRYTGWGMDAICQKCGRMWFDAEGKQRWIERLRKQNKDPDKYICNCQEPDIVYVPQTKRRGMLVTYSPHIKDFFYVIADNFVKNKSRGSYYGKRYDIYKAEARQKHNDWTDGRIRSYAIRKMIREFLTHMWMAWWYVMEKKEPPAKPYVIDILKHSDVSYPVVDIVEPPFRIRSVNDVEALYEIRGDVESKRRRKVI